MCIICTLLIAYTFASDLIRFAQRRIVLIDNYIDDSVLLMLAKRPSRQRGNRGGIG